MEELEQYLEELVQRAAAERRSPEKQKVADSRVRLKAKFGELLGRFGEEEQALEPLLIERCQCSGYVRELVEIDTVEGLRMRMYILMPEQPSASPMPAVIALHGHGYGSREIVGLEADGAERSSKPGLHKDFAVSLVREGYVVAAPELIGFGDRRLAEDKEKGAGSNSCFRLAAHLLMTGRTLAGLRIRETSRVVDYLREAMPAIDKERIGIMGISGGGLVAGFTAAIDARIRCAVVSGYASLFAESILARNHCLDNYIPGILEEAEMPELLGLIAPRGLFLESGEEDKVFPREPAEKAYRELQSLYGEEGARDAVHCDFFRGGHEINGEKAFAWLRGQLTDARGTNGGDGSGC
ncbi:alpha/beta hydrolase family protein [Paenibacillus sp. HB172176]|uniref:alpha/beta hydrolase family protein n=1 Tax=Paenibacillus sp. HB172176 TaxID=2493690 RepID=UPI00143C032C|nr:alpha/beta hydrolase family protein [Paenibacillus sp. HB172176]